MKVRYNLFDTDFEVICDMSKEQLANRIIDFANKLKTEDNDIKNLEYIQNIIDTMVVDIDESLV